VAGCNNNNNNNNNNNGLIEENYEKQGNAFSIA
jgi:hypothetical protein